MTEVEMKQIEMDVEKSLKEVNEYMAIASSFLDAVGEFITAAKDYNNAYANFCKTVEER